MSRVLTAPQFRALAQVPPATEWFANIDNQNTRRAYRNDLGEFMRFVGISAPEDLRRGVRILAPSCTTRRLTRRPGVP